VFGQIDTFKPSIIGALKKTKLTISAKLEKTFGLLPPELSPGRNSRKKVPGSLKLSPLNERS